MNQELVKKYREIRSGEGMRFTGGAASALRQARYALLNPQHPKKFEMTSEAQDLELEGKYVVVNIEPDEYHEWDEDIGELYEFGKRYDASDVACYGVRGDFTFSRTAGWNEELVSFDLPHGETFADLLRYYRASFSKQVAYEKAMAQVKDQFRYAVDVREGRYCAVGVIVRVFESQEACEEELAHESVWGVILPEYNYREADGYVNEVAWDLVRQALGVADSATVEVK